MGHAVLRYDARPDSQNRLQRHDFREEQKTFVGLTFTSNGEEDQAARFTDVGGDEVLHQVNIRTVSTLANASNKTFSNVFSSAAKKGGEDTGGEGGGGSAYRVNHRRIDQSTPDH